jgi:hypothetical protein
MDHYWKVYVPHSSDDGAEVFHAFGMLSPNSSLISIVDDKGTVFAVTASTPAIFIREEPKKVEDK